MVFRLERRTICFVSQVEKEQAKATTLPPSLLALLGEND